MLGVVPLPFGVFGCCDLTSDHVFGQWSFRFVGFVVDFDGGPIGPKFDELAGQDFEFALAFGDGVDGQVLRVLAFFCKIYTVQDF